jgi:hypothetical protein
MPNKTRSAPGFLLIAKATMNIHKFYGNVFPYHLSQLVGGDFSNFFFLQERSTLQIFYFRRIISFGLSRRVGNGKMQLKQRKSKRNLCRFISPVAMLFHPRHFNGMNPAARKIDNTS